MELWESVTRAWEVLATIAGAIVVAELAGYGLHRLLHSGRFPLLSRGHLIHHLEQYGPNQPMRSEKYCDATEWRASLGNIGMEWVVPSAAILGACWLLLWGIGVAWPYQCLAMVVLLGWPVLMFSYLHESITGRWITAGGWIATLELASFSSTGFFGHWRRGTGHSIGMDTGRRCSGTGNGWRTTRSFLIFRGGIGCKSLLGRRVVTQRSEARTQRAQRRATLRREER